jgi:glycosyltransferase involved in cell wall biosynthesis
MYRGKRISVVIPCHNEEDGIAAVMAQMPPIIDEVVVVDNNSTDRTAEVATAAGARVVTETRKGYGYAHKAGYAAAKGDIIVTMDGDGTYPPDSVPLLLYVMMEEKVDFITARRWYSKSGEVKSPVRLLGNAILSGTMMSLYFKFIIDSQSGMWMFKKDILPELDLTSNGMALSEEIKIEAFTHPGIRCLEMPIYYGARIGESKLNIWRDGFYNLFFLVKKRFMLRKKQPRLRVVEPLRPAAGAARGQLVRPHGTADRARGGGLSRSARGAPSPRRGSSLAARRPLHVHRKPARSRLHRRIRARTPRHAASGREPHGAGRPRLRDRCGGMRVVVAS